MAIRAPGQYITRRSSKKSRSHHKENRFLKKRFFTLSSDTIFPVSEHGRTCITRTKSKQDMEHGLIGRTFNINQGDLNQENKDTVRIFRFRIGTVKGTNCVGYFNGMYLTKDKVSGLVKKWHTLVEAETSVETTDGSTWRVFAMAVTKRIPGQTKRTSYIQSSQAKKIRKIMFEVIKEELDGVDVNKAMQKLSTEALGKLIETRCAEIHPVVAVISKVKPIKNMKVVITPGEAARREAGADENESELVMQENK